MKTLLEIFEENGLLNNNKLEKRDMKTEIRTLDDRLSLKQIFDLMDVNLGKLEKLVRTTKRDARIELTPRQHDKIIASYERFNLKSDLRILQNCKIIMKGKK